MLNKIPLMCYPDEETYLSSMDFYYRRYDVYLDCDIEPHRCAAGVINNKYPEIFDEEGMDKLIMLMSGMLWSIKNGGMPDDDPCDLAYNTWYAICDFATGEYDDLFTEEDLPLVKKDVQTLFDYFDAHPALKGN